MERATALHTESDVSRHDRRRKIYENEKKNKIKRQAVSLFVSPPQLREGERGSGVRMSGEAFSYLHGEAVRPLITPLRSREIERDGGGKEGGEKRHKGIGEKSAL